MTVLKLFLLVMSLTAGSLGGGAYLMTGLERTLVGGGVISAGQFAGGVALGQSTPGPMAAFTAAVGNAALGLPGALAATAGLLVVSLTAVLLLGRVPQAWYQAPRVRGALAAVQPCAVALALYLAFRLASAGSITRPLVPALLLGGVVLGRLKQVPPPALVIGAVVLGMLLQGSSIVSW